MSQKPLTVAQIGCGYWGPNLLRNFYGNKNCTVKYVAELSEERRNYVASNFPRTQAIPEVDTVLNDPEVEAVIVATPAAMHYEQTRQALLSGKHAFVEKPLAMSGREVNDLISLANERNLTLMVGHTFLYNVAVQYLKELIKSGELGQVYYIYAQRLNLGVIRSDVNALWNLAPHDISILTYLLDQKPVSVSAQGTDYIQPGIEDVVFVNLVFPDKIRANIQVSWLDPNKVRKITVVGSKKMVVYDDIADDKIIIYDKGIEQQQYSMPFDTVVPAKLVNRVGDIRLPRIDFKEPLKLEAADFVEACRTGKFPVSGIESGRNVVEVLEAAQESLKSNGKVIRLS